MTALTDGAARTADALKTHFSAGFTPSAGLILGSGLGKAIERMDVDRAVDYAALPEFPRAGVAGHPGFVAAGVLGGLDVLALAGRPHLYEHGDGAAAAFPARLIHSLGAKILIVTNAAGAVDPRLCSGDLMAIRDHIDLTFCSPRRPSAGTGPPCSSPYDGELRQLARSAAADLGYELREGVYAGVRGPSYETRAEVRMLALAGAAAVGMSTVPEVVAARQLGMRVLGVSCIANLACGVGGHPLTHAEVIEATGSAAGRLGELLGRVAARIADRRIGEREPAPLPLLPPDWRWR